MREYFESEMRLLHEAAADFAKAHPEQARMLNLAEVRDRDPYVERLLEGMAFIAAQIRTRIDDSENAISEQLLEQLCPGQLRGYASRTVMNFAPDANAQGGKSLPAGSIIRSAPVGEGRQQCHFSTLADLQILPLQVSGVQTRETGNGSTELTLTLAHAGAGNLADLDLSTLDIYLHCDPALALALCHGLSRPKGKLRFSVEGASCGELDAADVSMPYLEELFHTGHHRGLPGFSLLQDYFAWRERFFFIRIAGLSQLTFPDKGRECQLQVELPLQLPAEHQLKREHFQLNCVPAVNLYELDADPLDVDQQRAEYRFLPDQKYPDTVVLHEILSLTGRDHRSARLTDYQPFYRAHDFSQGEYCYRLTRRDLGLATPQPFISLSGPGLIPAQTLSARVRVSDGYLPRRYLAENQITRPGEGVPSSLSIRNLNRPCSYLPCPDSSAYRWQLQALMQLSAVGLANRNSLQSLMGLLDWTDRQENQRRRQALQEVSVTPVTRMLKGMLYRGAVVTVQLSQGDFLSLDDIYLFGCVLHRLLSQLAPINESVELRVIAQPSQKEFVWEPQVGCAAPM